jgi:cytochrome b pre-mRNA-processing protein 3
MKYGLFRRTRKEDTIAALYDAIVAQARSPALYRAYGVPDTVTGRLEMILLHTLLFCRRAGDAAADLRAMAQDVFDLFCCDMDGNLREMGVGDLAVPRKMRQIGEAFYGRAMAYEAPLNNEDEPALAEALARNVFSGAAADGAASRRLATYMIWAGRELARQEDTALAAGEIKFPNPETPASVA